MSLNRRILNQLLAGFLFIALVSHSNTSFAADGEALFKANCANCHKPLEDYIGPMLQGARKREPNPEWALKWVNNVNSMLETDPYAKALLAKYNSRMTQFNLKADEITAILDYADAYKAPVPVAPAGGAEAPAEDNSLLFGILTVLSLVQLILFYFSCNFSNFFFTFPTLNAIIQIFKTKVVSIDRFCSIRFGLSSGS